MIKEGIKNTNENRLFYFRKNKKITILKSLFFPIWKQIVNYSKNKSEKKDE